MAQPHFTDEESEHVKVKRHNIRGAVHVLNPYTVAAEKVDEMIMNMKRQKPTMNSVSGTELNTLTTLYFFLVEGDEEKGIKSNNIFQDSNSSRFTSQNTDFYTVH